MSASKLLNKGMERSSLWLSAKRTSERRDAGSPSKKMLSSAPRRKSHWYCRYSWMRLASSGGRLRLLMRASARSTRASHVSLSASERMSAGMSSPIEVVAIAAASSTEKM